MAHFAQLDENNVVMQVIVVNNSELLDDNGQESEAKGITFCQAIFGANTRWVQTSYNSTFRVRYAGIGFIYDSDIDAFVPPKPYPSWVLNAAADWEAPIPKPAEIGMYSWDEDSQSWVSVSPFPSWTLNADGQWEPPTPKPAEGKYFWDEYSQSWVEEPSEPV